SEERPAGARVPRGQIDYVIRGALGPHVSIGAVHVHLRSARFPYVLHVVERLTVRTPPPAYSSPLIHGHGDRVFLLAGLRDVIDIARIVPGHENLVPLRTLAEYLLPRPGGFET